MRVSYDTTAAATLLAIRKMSIRTYGNVQSPSSVEYERGRQYLAITSDYNLGVSANPNNHTGKEQTCACVPHVPSLQLYRGSFASSLFAKLQALT